ncbi:chemotaxis protein CheD, partial [Patescibacteria group bacterium]|nr:chemotaxis protein CheD [Patescibacteria group bacterium]
MDQIININTGEMAVAKSGAVITTSGIGSCVFVCLYDSLNKVGGAVHSMLPTRVTPKKSDVFVFDESDSIGKYVDEAIVKLVDDVIRAGAKKENLKAKIVGGSSMFKVFDTSKIGNENVKAAEKILQLLNVPVKAESTGGHIGRSAKFNLGNGVVEV